ncbi:SET domain protein [Plasmodium gonderi]|uniref:SET domain protein n=1 Tax=Plasmodium gonderi TaxID=77519 RepID=A0A1Y1JJE4_PLAGO|nr:SET domain protein [Plasmodium gonderi]GAW80922.1 SET domain protein [Plasmodium gonderi]
METIFRKLRRSHRKKKEMVEVDIIDEKDWAHAKTLDLEGDSFDYSEKKHRNDVEKTENEKREIGIDDFYMLHDDLGDVKNYKKKKYLVGSFSRMNEDGTNESTDFANEYYIKNKKDERNRCTNEGEYIDRSKNKHKSRGKNEHESVGVTSREPYAYHDFEKYKCETKEYSDVEDDMESYEEDEEEEEEYPDGVEVDGEDVDEEEGEEEEGEEEYADGEEVDGEYAFEAGEVEYGEEEEYPDEEAINEHVDGETEDVYEDQYENEMIEEESDGGTNSKYKREKCEGSRTQVKIGEHKRIVPEESNQISIKDEKSADVVEESEENEDYVDEKLEIYNNEEIDKQVEIAYVKGKGRCMFTRKNLDAGSIIFIEKPLLIITPSLNEQLWTYLNKLNNEDNFELPLKWHYAALCTITLLDERDFKACIDKWIPEPNREADADVFNVLEKVCEKKTSKNGKKYYYYQKKLIDPQIYDRIIQVWHYNAFGHHTDNEGLVLYNRISMLAHSCNSTACWHYGNDDSFVLRARVKLTVGDELTISYLGDDDLYKSCNIRREKLTNWLFVCMCSRCTNPIDYSRGFKCSTCGIGTFFIKSEYHDEIPIITKCNICESEISEATAYEYIEYENSYIERLQETDKNDISDALAVYIQADKIFTQHWIMYQLYTILFEGYRDKCNWEKAIYYQMQRIKYAVDVIPRANYVLAWLYEELGEAQANSINTDILLSEKDFTISYEEKKRICSHFLKSIHLLEILCGYSHDYLKDSLNKYYRIDSLTCTDAPQIEE